MAALTSLHRSVMAALHRNEEDFPGSNTVYASTCIAPSVNHTKPFFAFFIQWVLLCHYLGFFGF